MRDEIEVEPGVVVERRSFLGLGAAALLAPRGPRALPLGRAADEPRLSLEEFVEQVVPVAKELRAGLAVRPERSAEDRYLFTLASYAVRLGDVPPPELRESSQGEGVSIGASWAGDPFVVLHWRMAPGTRIRTHAHTYGHVCTVGLEGSARVSNWETVGALDLEAEDPFEVRMTNDQVLEPCGINLVPLSHGFCHGFLGGPGDGVVGARGLDITTKLGERRETPYLELEQRPVDAAARLYRARWRLE